MNKSKQVNQGQKARVKQKSKANKKHHTPTHSGLQNRIGPEVALQRGLAAPQAVISPTDMLTLQRTVSNQAVVQMLAARNHGQSTPNPANSIQRALGLPTKKDLRKEGLSPGFGGRGWKRLEKALDAYRELDDNDYEAQLTAIANIEGIMQDWWDSHVNSKGVARKSKEQPKADRIKRLRGQIRLRKNAIGNEQSTPGPRTPTQTPSQTPSHTPTIVSPPSPWESATLTANPALLTKHQGQKTYIKAGQTFATVEGGVIGPTTTFFQGGNPTEVTVQSQHTKQTHIIPAGKFISSIEGGTIGNSIGFGSDVEVKVEQTSLLNQGQQGSVVSYRNGGSKQLAWVPQGTLQIKSEPGSLVIYNETTTYWVPQAHLETSSAQWADKTTTPLFPEDGPKAEQVLQGALGDCYLMAALASIVQTDPTFPERELLKENSDHTVTVKLYEVTQGSNVYSPSDGEYIPKGFASTPKYVKVNKSVPQAAGKDLYAQKNLWVQLVQKAYTAGGFTGNLLDPKKTNTNSYENIESGSGKHAFEVLTGQEGSLTGLEAKKRHLGATNAATAVYGQIRAALHGRKAVTAGTRSFTNEEKQQAQNEGVGHSAGEAKLRGIVAEHVYSVVEVKDGNVIKLRNPWGQYGRQLNGTPVPEGDGTVELYMTEFFKWFSSLHISGQIVPVPNE